MHPRTCLLALGLALLASGCSPLSVTDDYDTSFDFARLKTFGWPPMMKLERVDQLDVQRIESAVKQRLEAKGFTVSPTPDFLVSLHGDQHTQVGFSDWGYGPGWWGPGGADAYAVLEGVLVIDIVDSAERQMVWRGSGTREVDPDRTPEEAVQRIDEDVEKILATFPPKKAH